MFANTRGSDELSWTKHVMVKIQGFRFQVSESGVVLEFSQYVLFVEEYSALSRCAHLSSTSFTDKMQYMYAASFDMLSF